MSRLLPFLLLCLLAPRSARADEIATASTTLDVMTATELSPAGSTRWSRITVAGPDRVLWLVPVRPGGQIAWASDTWLDALDETTAPRILPPPATCSVLNLSKKPERIPSFARSGTRLGPGTFTLTTSPADLGAFHPRADVAARAAALYASGWNLVAIEVNASALATTGTLRVTDADPTASLPVVVTQGGTDARMTSFVLASGPVTAGQELDPAVLSWSAVQSDYVDRRAALLAAPGTWLRESATHAGVEAPLAVPNGASVPAIATTEPFDPSLTITRFAGRLPTAASTATPFSAGTERLQLRSAGTVSGCSVASTTKPVPEASHRKKTTTSDPIADQPVVTGDGCGSTAVSVAAAVASSSDDSTDDGSGSSSDSTDDGSDSTDDGSKPEDPGTDVPIEWGDDGSDDGTKTDALRPRSRKTALHATPSPVSRLALLAIAIVLPFRRRLRRVTL